MSAKENLELKKYCNDFLENRRVLGELGARGGKVKIQKSKKIMGCTKYSIKFT